jgi:hypothetical protein
MMKARKRLLGPGNAVLMLLLSLLLFASARAQETESLILSAKGHGLITSSVEKRKITAALVVLRQDGTALITVTADLQLQAEGTWKATSSSTEEIVLTITGGAVKGEMIGSGKLLVNSDTKSIRALTINLKSTDGQKISVTFVADYSKEHDG